MWVSRCVRATSPKAPDVNPRDYLFASIPLGHPSRSVRSDLPEGITIASPFVTNAYPIFRLGMRNQTEHLDSQGQCSVGAQRILHQLCEKVVIGVNHDLSEMTLLPGLDRDCTNKELYLIPRRYLDHLLSFRTDRDDMFLVQISDLSSPVSRHCDISISLIREIDLAPEWYLAHLIKELHPRDLVWSVPYLKRAISELVGYGNGTDDGNGDGRPVHFPWTVSDHGHAMRPLLDQLEQQFGRCQTDHQRERMQTVQSHLMCHPDYATEMIREDRFFRINTSQFRAAKTIAWVCILLHERFTGHHWTSRSLALFSGDQITEDNMIDLDDAIQFHAPGSRITKIDTIPHQFTELISPSKLFDRLDLYLINDRQIDLLGKLDWTRMAITGSILSILLPKHSYRPDISVLDTSDLLGQGDPVSIMCSVTNQIDWLRHLREMNRIISATLGKGGSWRCDRVTEIHLSSVSVMTDIEWIHLAQKARARAPFIHSTADATEQAIYCDPSLAEDSATYRVIRGSPILTDQRSSWQRYDPLLEEWTIGERRNRYALSTKRFLEQRCCAIEQYRMTYQHPKLAHPIMFIPVDSGMVNALACQSWPTDRAMCNGTDLYLTPSAALALTTRVVHAPKDATLAEIIRVASRGYRVIHREINHAIPDDLECHSLQINQKLDPPAWHQFVLPF